eukprot:365778-Chlamydomonas_euryale.AAC.17
MHMSTISISIPPIMRQCTNAKLSISLSRPQPLGDIFSTPTLAAACFQVHIFILCEYGNVPLHGMWLRISCAAAALQTGARMAMRSHAGS